MSYKLKAIHTSLKVLIIGIMASASFVGCGTQDISPVKQTNNVQNTPYESNWNTLNYGKSIKYKIPNNNYTKIKIIARIKWKEMAGTASLMRVSINNTILNNQNILNKDAYYKLKDGRKYKWFDKVHNSFSLCYSPNFQANYSSSTGYSRQGYQIISGGDPYKFIFNINNFLSNNKINVLKIENIANELKGYPYHNIQIEYKYILL